MAKYKSKQKTYSYARAITLAVFALMFIGAVAGCVIGWLQVKNLTTKLEAITQTEAEEGDSAVMGDITSARKQVKTAQFVAPDIAGSYSSLTGTTCTELPEGARHIQVGDDLSGALLYIDYPNLNLNSMSSGEYIGTSTYYKLGRQNMQNAPFGYGKYSSASASFSSILFTNYFVATNSGMGSSSSWKLNPITAYELPEDFGVVTNVDTSKLEHTALYISEGGTSGGEEETPIYPVTDTSPLPGHSFECGIEFTLGDDVKSYTDGYLCVNVNKVKPLLTYGTDKNLIIFNSQNSIGIKNGNLSVLYMGASATGGGEQKEQVICGASTSSEYVYVDIDLENVSMINEAVTESMLRYLNGDISHRHLSKPVTAFPVEGCSASCITELRQGLTYAEGYIVVKPSAMNAYASEHTGKLFSVNNYDNFCISDGKLKYKQWQQGTNNGYAVITVCDGNVQSEYVYIHMPEGMTYNPNLAAADYGAAVIGYLPANHAQFALPEDPQKEGYNFVGWYYGTESEHIEITDPEYGCRKYEGEHITSDTSFHAHFAIKQFIVTYNTNGGGEQASVTVKWNESAPLPELTREGYNLTGWYLEDGTEYTGQAIKRGTTLKAEWVIKVFKVTFYCDGKIIKTMDVTYGTQLTDVSEAAGLALSYIKAANSRDEEITGAALASLLVTDDVTVELTGYGETAMDRLISVLEQYKVLFIVGAAIVFAGAVAAAVYVTKKLNGR